MHTLFVLLLLVSIGSLIVGLIKPSFLKMKSRNHVGGILGGVVALFFILIAITSPSQPPVVGTQTAPPQQTQDTFIDKGVGDEVVLETLQFKVLSVKEQGMIQDSFGSSAVADAGTKFVVIALDITNLTSANLDFPSDIPLVDSQGRQYANYEKTIGNIDHYLDGTVLPPGILKQGVVVYEIPLNSTSYFLESGKGGTNDIYRIKLQSSSSTSGLQAVTTTPSTQQQKTIYASIPAAAVKPKTTVQAPPSPQPTASIQANVSAASPSLTPSPITLSGNGQQATQQFTLQQGLSIFTMQNSGQSNFIVHLLDSEGNSVDGLVNEVGDFSGSKAVRILSTGSYLLSIKSDGPWTITITQPRPTSAPMTSSLSGKGSQATAFFNLSSGLHTFALTHDGNNNFIVHLLDRNGNSVDGLVNEIGTYKGSQAEHISSSGPYLLNIQADGNWTVQIQ